MKEIYERQTEEFFSLKGCSEFKGVCDSFVCCDKRNYEESIWIDTGRYEDGKYCEYYDYNDSKGSKDSDDSED